MKRSCKRKITVPYNYRKLVNLIFDESYVFTFNYTMQACYYDITTYVNVFIVFKRRNLLSDDRFYFVPGISNDIVRYKIVSRVKLNKRDHEFRRNIGFRATIDYSWKDISTRETSVVVRCFVSIRRANFSSPLPVR